MMVEVRAGCADWLKMTENAAVIQISAGCSEGAQRAAELVELGSFQTQLKA